VPLLPLHPTFNNPLAFAEPALHSASMSWFRRKEAPGLTEELVQRVWDATTGLKALEDRFDASLKELELRYRRAEQAELRREQGNAKKTPCEEDEVAAGPPGFNDVTRRDRASRAVTSEGGDTRRDPRARLESRRVALAEKVQETNSVTHPSNQRD